MLIGMIFNAGAVVGFAFVPNFAWLIVLRVVEAIGSSLSVVSCLALVARTFPDDGKRTKALSTAYIGYSIGLILGYPLGPVAFALSSLSTPFLILAVVTLLDGAMRLVIIQPDIDRTSSEKIKFTYYFSLIKDPYFVSALLCCFCLYVGGGIFMATGPNWMIETLNAEMWQMGVIMCVSLCFMLIGEVIVGICGTKYRWQFTLAGMWLCVVGMALYPECKMIWVVIAPECLFRLGAGIVICCVGTALSYITDIRHKPGIYGPTFGLLTASNDLGFVLGPILGGVLVDIISFAWLYRAEAMFIFIISLFALSLRNIPERVKLPVTNVDVTGVQITSEPALDEVALNDSALLKPTSDEVALNESVPSEENALAI
ncbi:chromaffin granule amine transporter-like [Tubulanus polymorphus]|uniref:chromaffin granule amine transporter-like n=1 Tax=Tubulanus polymorphus TaxID=672921 RepID=UPI003DA42C6A